VAFLAPRSAAWRVPEFRPFWCGVKISGIKKPPADSGRGFHVWGVYRLESHPMTMAISTARAMRLNHVPKGVIICLGSQGRSLPVPCCRESRRQLGGRCGFQFLRQSGSRRPQGSSGSPCHRCRRPFRSGCSKG
jgi:hypothetical protein